MFSSVKLASFFNEQKYSSLLSRGQRIWPNISSNYLVFYFLSELFLERHENISILFADICNFTEMTTSLPVDKLVETLNDLFGKFDDAADVS